MLRFAVTALIFVANLPVLKAAEEFNRQFDLAFSVHSKWKADKEYVVAKNSFGEDVIALAATDMLATPEFISDILGLRDPRGLLTGRIEVAEGVIVFRALVEGREIQVELGVVEEQPADQSPYRSIKWKVDVHSLAEEQNSHATVRNTIVLQEPLENIFRTQLARGHISSSKNWSANREGEEGDPRSRSYLDGPVAEPERWRPPSATDCRDSF